MGEKATSQIAGYQGIIKEKGKVVWTCQHTHTSHGSARACATVEREQRKIRGVDSPPN